MMGSIIKDIEGNVYELSNINKNEFKFFDPNGDYTNVEL